MLTDSVSFVKDAASNSLVSGVSYSWMELLLAAD